jgi:PAS domain S-box-containing protein
LKTRLVIAASAVAVAAAAASAGLVLSSNHDGNAAARAVLIVAVGLLFVGSGLFATVRRPDNRIGLLMALVGFYWFLTALADANTPWVYTVGVAVSLLIYGGFAHVVLAFPTGRLEAARSRTIVWLAYLDVTLVQVLLMLFRDHVGVANRPCADCPGNELVVANNHAAATAVDDLQRGIALALVIAAVATLWRRARLATPAARRTLMPVVVTATVTISLVAALVVATAFSASFALQLNWIVLASFAAVPLGFLLGLLRSRLARSGILRLVVETPDEPSLREVELALRDATGDPTLRFAFWVDDAHGYINVRGKPFAIPEDTPTRVTTRVQDSSGHPIAALMHDRALLDDSGLLEEVIGVVRMGLQKDRGERALRVSEIRGRALLDAIPDLMFRISLGGRYLDYRAPNEADLVEAEVLGKTVWDRLPKELADRFMEAGRRAVGRHQAQTLEYELDLDGERRYYEGRVAASGDDEFVLIVRNITQRKRAEDELRREREFLGIVAGATPNFLCAIDREGRITHRGVNRTFAERLGYDDPDACGRLLAQLVAAPEDQDAMTAAVARTPSEGDGVSWHEHTWISRDGRRIPVAWSLTPLSGVYEDWFLVAAVDVTERKEREEELRASRARIVAAGDDERRRLERNLHDGAQQRLVSLSLALRLAETRLESDPDAAARTLAGAREELGQALEELRELARGIHPAILTDRGLGAALEALASRAPLPVEIDHGGERLPPSVEVAAYYVVSEALANVAKYADARTVRVSVARENGAAHVLVADDGVGGADPTAGSGLRGLADRIAALNGTLEVESPPGAGTIIRAEIPFPDNLRQP